MVTAVLLAGCGRETEASAPEVRPVRAVTVAKRDVGEIVSFTGRIEAENETRLSFRIGGRMIERSVNVGDRVEPGQVVAKLEAHNELNALRSAQAAVTAAQAQFTEAQNNYERQKFLLARDVASRVQYERAEQSRDTAGAQLDAAQAQLNVARDQVGVTELKADAGGIVIATAAEPGEVVQAGQLIVRVAPKGGRDAVFDVPGQVLRSAPHEPVVEVALTDDPSVTTTGRVREVAPQAVLVPETRSSPGSAPDSRGDAEQDRHRHSARTAAGHCRSAPSHDAAGQDEGRAPGSVDEGHDNARHAGKFDRAPPDQHRDRAAGQNRPERGRQRIEP
jgi:multidrug efflux pump subunit AcrA (membrane-fusion protein)